MAALALAATVASSVASIATAGKNAPKPPDESSPEAQAARRDMIQARQSQVGHRQTILAGETEDPQVRRPTLLGGT